MLPPFVNERQARLAVPYPTGGVIPFLEPSGFRASAALGDMSRPFPTLENITESTRYRYVLDHIWGSCPAVHTIHSPGGALEQFTNRPRGPEVGGARPASWLSAPASPGSRPTGGSRCLRARLVGTRLHPESRTAAVCIIFAKKRCELRRLPLPVPLPPEVTTSSGFVGRQSGRSCGAGQAF
jgi:hypothetical protein